MDLPVKDHLEKIKLRLPSFLQLLENFKTSETKEKINVDLKFALPGKERQDSVYSGLQVIDPSSELVCVHDSARPLVTSNGVEKVLRDGWVHGAAVQGVPAKATIKELNLGSENGLKEGSCTVAQSSSVLKDLPTTPSAKTLLHSSLKKHRLERWSLLRKQEKELVEIKVSPSITKNEFDEPNFQNFKDLKQIGYVNCCPRLS